MTKLRALALVTGLGACGGDADTGSAARLRPVSVGWMQRQRLDRAELCGPTLPWQVEEDLFALPAPRPLPAAPPSDAIREPTAAQAEAMELLLGTTVDGHFRRERVDQVAKALALVRAQGGPAADEAVVSRRSIRRLSVSLAQVGGPLASAPTLGGLESGPSMELVETGSAELDALGPRFGVVRVRPDVVGSLRVELGLPVDTVTVARAYAAVPGVVHASPLTRIGLRDGLRLIEKQGLLHFTVLQPVEGTDPLLDGDTAVAWFLVDPSTWQIQELHYRPGDSVGHGVVEPFARPPRLSARPYADLDTLLAETRSPVWWEALAAVGLVAHLGCGPLQALSAEDRTSHWDQPTAHFDALRDALLARRGDGARALLHALDHPDEDVRAAALEGLRWWSGASGTAEDRELWAAWVEARTHG